MELTADYSARLNKKRPENPVQTKQTVKNFACKLQESMSKLSECELIKRIHFIVQQVCQIVEIQVTKKFTFA